MLLVEGEERLLGRWDFFHSPAWTDDVCRIRIFTELDRVACERRSRAAADISLAPGEYAANEGDERALFALLDGRIEAVKAVDGIDRVVGERLPGDIFGEVPITLGT